MHCFFKDFSEEKILEEFLSDCQNDPTYFQRQHQKNHLSFENKIFFGRFKGRPLGSLAEESLRNIHEFSCSRWNPWPTRVVLDIGCGYGEHLLDSLEKDQERYYIGVEVFQNALGYILTHLPQFSEHRFSIFYEPVQYIWPLLKGPVEEVRLLFPDPWPKKKHQKRRLLQRDFVDILWKHLASEGTLLLASDHMNLFLFMHETLEESHLFHHEKGWTTEEISHLLDYYDLKDHWGNLKLKTKKGRSDENFSTKDTEDFFQELQRKEEKSQNFLGLQNLSTNTHHDSFIPLRKSCLIPEEFLGPSWPYKLTRYGQKAQQEGRPLGWSLWRKRT